MRKHPLKTTSSTGRRPGVIFQPETHQLMQQGFRQVVRAIQPTLGPLPHLVAIEQSHRNKAPELLDSGGIIARRIIEVKDWRQDAGAMFIRHMLWKLYERVGDGTVTAAVLFDAVYSGGDRYIVAGGNAMRLKHGMMTGLEVISSELDRQMRSLSGEGQISQLAEAICSDRPLAQVLGEIFDLIGEYGRLEIRAGMNRELEREYVEGMYWDGGLYWRSGPDGAPLTRCEADNAAILITDLEVETAQELIPALEMAVQHRIKNVFLVIRKISENAMSLLYNPANQQLVQVVAVKTPPGDTNRVAADMEDMALLTQSRPLLKNAGDTLNRVSMDHFGHARKIWADQNYLGIIGGRANVRVLRQHFAALQAAYMCTERLEDRRMLRERIGRLMGGSATLSVGGSTPSEVELRKEIATHTAEAIRGALREGVVPGGGVALLDCRPRLQDYANGHVDEETRIACQILSDALCAPTRALLENSGLNPGAGIGLIEQAGPGYGIDVTRNQLVDMAQAGIYDSAAVVKSAVQTAVTSAVLALTTDVLVCRRQPKTNLTT